MNQYNEISTLQYMGSKARIISHICEPIIKNEHIKTVVDLFAGAGSVGYALKPYKNVISNDIEYYAYIINQAILNGCAYSIPYPVGTIGMAAHMGCYFGQLLLVCPVIFPQSILKPFFPMECQIWHTILSSIKKPALPSIIGSTFCFLRFFISFLKH